MVKIAVLASFNMDLVMLVERRPAAGETLQGDFAMHLGGKGFNQAVAARRLGADVVVCGRVGDDEFGRRFLAALDDEGIDRRAVVVDPVAGTGVATIDVEPDGTNTIVQSPRANRNVTIEDAERVEGLIEGEDFDYPRLLHDVDLLLVTLECGEEAALDHASVLRSEKVMLNAAPATSVSEMLIKTAGVIVANEIETGAILGRSITRLDEATVASGELMHHGIKVATVITLGGEGAVASGRFRAGAFEVDAVDTTGAGDAFCGALAVRLAEGAELVDAMRFANAAGALACTKHGAYPSMPYRADVEALIAQQGSSR